MSNKRSTDSAARFAPVLAYEAVVIGASAGGLQTLKAILPALGPGFPLPIVIVAHVDERSDGFLVEYLNRLSAILVKEAEDKEPLRGGTAYMAPPGYHLLIEADRTLSLSVDGRENFSRPSIDVLFESAAAVFRNSLIGVVLSGANADGAQGLKAIKERGGLAVVQNPHTAEASAMPKAALEATPVDHILEPDTIGALLTRICNGEKPIESAARLRGAS
jgi:two-component system, chemotaxis family, protein-glutamate methylesterase/glutaminase